MFDLDFYIININGTKFIIYLNSSTKLLIDHLTTIDKLWLVNEKKDDGFTALHLACLNNYFDIVRLLVDSVPILNLDSKNLNQQTPLHLAVERKHLEIIKFLFNNSKYSKCNVNIQDKDGDTPLHCLLRNYSVSKIKMLSNDRDSVKKFSTS